ncbi:response regulator [Leptolyngbya sp. BC1307]|uniref:response regulator n=1 Tax=Leptolyngbya sp. BC1307 TaxID=2029589 RepID=UPI000EFD5160|nr:response regulator [Leptolyngbya sp. BC1307]
MRILLVDDDEALMESLAERLIQQRYAVDIAVNGRSAQDYVDLFNYDLVVLDLMLPDGDGIQFCGQFRQGGYTNPLMILTAKGSTAEKVSALDAGADDYVVKPFDFDELCARIRALLRRDAQGLPPVLQWGPLSLDPSTCETTYQQQPIHLTPKEFSMMELFLRQPHRVYSLGAIIDDLWSFEDSPGEDAIRTHIKGLRRKLQTAGAPKDLIKTVYGLGYRLNEKIVWSHDELALTAEVRESEVYESKAYESGVYEPGVYEKDAYKEGDADVALTSQAIAKACQRYLSSASQQVTILEAAASAISRDALDPQLRYASQINAHKLAGSLGCFGIAEGSQIARQIETQLRSLSSFSAQETANPVSQSINQLVQALRQQLDQASADVATQSVSAPVPAGKPLLLIVSEDENLTQQLVQIAAADDLQAQVVTDPQQAKDLFDLRRQSAKTEDSFWSDSISYDPILYNPISSLAACAVAAVNGSGASQLASQLPDLLLLDLAADATAFSGLIRAARQDYAMPTMVLADRQLALADRLELVKQGVALMSDRTAPPAQIIASAASQLKARVSSIRIAIAAADPQILALLKIRLEPQGFQVQTFESALDLWQWLTAASTAASPTAASPNSAEATSEPKPTAPKVDMLILDVEMPEMNGLEICQVLRADTRFQTLPILFLTAHPEDSLRNQAFQAGANGFIDKAIAPTDLAARLRNQLDHQPLAHHPSINPPQREASSSTTCPLIRS